MTHRSPFITETNEPAFTDCQFCAGLMLVAEWTSGEAIHDRHGNTLDAVGLKRLRERIRVLSGDTCSGAVGEPAPRQHGHGPIGRIGIAVRTLGA